ncbi:MAG: hypothetical protein HC930_05725 [Hydrococcus sp. SU_1_0]|nr:hypothetical protein [Hydrococcus sp. SU_1_0]
MCRAKPNVPFVRLAKIVFKKCAVEKIKIQKRWQCGRLSVDSIVPLLYVYFCRSFLLCRLLGLQVTFCGFAKLGHLKNDSLDFAQIFNSITNVEFSTSAPILPNRCYLLPFFRHLDCFFF